MRGGDVTLGDRDEAGEPRFRGEQIVAPMIEAAFRDAVAKREDLARGIEEEAELHPVEELLRDQGHCREPADQRSGCHGRALQ